MKGAGGVLKVWPVLTAPKVLGVGSAQVKSS